MGHDTWKSYAWAMTTNGPSPSIEKPPRPPHAGGKELPRPQIPKDSTAEKDRESETERLEAQEQAPRVPAMERDVVLSAPEAAGSSSSPASSSYSSFAETRVICRV